jgi:putative transposase
VHVLLQRQGWKVNVKKTRRIYRELGLQMRASEAHARHWFERGAERRSGA